MEFRQLAGAGLSVPVLSFGTATFGGTTPFFRAWGTTQAQEARRLVDTALDAGITLFDTADAYSDGRSEELLGQAIGSRRDRVLLSTKVAFRTEPGANGLGLSRHHVLRACEASLRRLGTDYIDLYQLHAFDELTPVEETLYALDGLVRSGKVRYIGCSNFSGWQVMKALALSEKYGLPRYVVHQAYYSLIGREFEWELMPLGRDQNIGTTVWSPLAGGWLTGKVRRNQPLPAGSRVSENIGGPTIELERLYAIVDTLGAIAEDTGRTVAQVALNWLLQRPTVTSIILGARSEEQLLENLGAVGWNLTAEQIAMLDSASATVPIYPYWHQRGFFERNPSLLS